MVGWHHRLNGRESEQGPGGGDGQGSLACCSLWGREESDTIESLSLSDLKRSSGKSVRSFSTENKTKQTM